MAKKRGHVSHEEHMDESWLIPYADLLTLLLAVFIVLFASSNVDKEKFAAIAKAFHSEFGGEGTVPIGELVDPDNLQDIDLPLRFPTPAPSDMPTDPSQAGEGGNQEVMDMEQVQRELESYLIAEDLSESIEMRIDDRGLVISFNDSVLFASASADIRTEYIPVLTKVAGIINRLSNFIRVEGHTDSNPISTARFPTNWELSSARASSVVRLFIDRAGVRSDKVAAVGYADTRPVADNGTNEGRARNRRVDIIILSSKYNSLESEMSKPTVFSD